MKDILEKVIDKHKTPQGEGLIEFLYAISIEKLTLKKEHLLSVSDKLNSIKNNEIVQAFNLYIKEAILAEKPTLDAQISLLELEIKFLKTQLNTQ